MLRTLLFFIVRVFLSKFVLFTLKIAIFAEKMFFEFKV